MGLARGPNFMKNKITPPFRNVDIYPMLCEIAQIRCNPHNGSLSILENYLVYPSIPTTTTTTKLGNYSLKFKHSANLLYFFLLVAIIKF